MLPRRRPLAGHLSHRRQFLCCGLAGDANNADTAVARAAAIAAGAVAAAVAAGAVAAGAVAAAAAAAAAANNDDDDAGMSGAFDVDRPSMSP